ncbi:MAG: hypothetical protein JW882_14865 [Deltaproteobacteria bacterium]|nr:hypothetical protein [Deltaproteobacteria bacterium]
MDEENGKSNKLDDLLNVLGTAKKVQLRQALEDLREGKELSSSQLRLIEDYEAELKQSKENEEESSAPDRVFANLTHVYKYLDENGWKVSQATVYKHAREGRIKPDHRHKYTLKDVRFYAESFLHKKDTTQSLKDEELQRNKLKEEIRLKKIQNEREFLKLMHEKKLYIFRSD